MEPMTKEQFKRKYLDTHKELTILDKLEKGRKGSLIKKSSGDKNIYSRGKIPGKKMIEKEAMAKRYGQFEEYLLDAVTVRADEIFKIKFDKLLELVTKNKPTKIDSEVSHEFTFTDMVKRATIELEKMETVDATGKENASADSSDEGVQEQSS